MFLTSKHNLEVPRYVEVKQSFLSAVRIVGHSSIIPKNSKVYVLFLGSTSWKRPCCFQASSWMLCRPWSTGCTRWSHSWLRTSPCMGTLTSSWTSWMPIRWGWDLGCVEGGAVGASISDPFSSNWGGKEVLKELHLCLWGRRLLALQVWTNCCCDSISVTKNLPKLVRFRFGNVRTSLWAFPTPFLFISLRWLTK